MRDIIDVIELIKKQVPDDFENQKDLFLRFDSIISSAPYQAPEIKHLLWDRLQDTLIWGLGVVDTSWKFEIGEIMAGRK